MAAIPKPTVEDDYVRGLTCAICGRPDLFVQHLPDYPDFVTCRHCDAAFVVEDTGERVMYGKIPDEYPETTEFALRQWVWLEAVDRRALEERPRPSAGDVSGAGAGLRPGAVVESELRAEIGSERELEPADEISGPDPDVLAARLQPQMPTSVPSLREPELYPGPTQAVPSAAETAATEEALQAWTREETPPPAHLPPREAEAARPIPRLPITPPMAAVGAPSAAQEGEPPPTHRHRVVIRGDRIRMPINACAHCHRSPAPDRITVVGSLPRQGDPAGRRPATFQVPLCRDCSRRAHTLSSEQRGASLMAHLTGALVGLVVIVAILAANVIPFEASLPLGLGVLATTWLVGYGITAALLLGRARRAPPPADAVYVRTTLQVVADPAAPQTAFEWRNRETAVSFFQANGAASIGEPAAIPEATASS